MLGHSAISETPISALPDTGAATVTPRPSTGTTAFTSGRTTRPTSGTTVHVGGSTPRPYTTTTTRP